MVELELGHRWERSKEILLNISIKSAQFLALRPRPLYVPVLPTEFLVIILTLLSSIEILQDLESGEARVINSKQLRTFACELVGILLWSFQEHLTVQTLSRRFLNFFGFRLVALLF
jgi:hypothetical protein